ncbi:hypothetical protein MARBORIA2_03250 [Methanobrevibacter arboriphilus]|jgi:hypothetical protein|uniref:hypothetical protein n=1 Tax=Methanobrevibacter arboriphilus TaxID=39441 RepID=UPI0022EF3C2F|nr:hypothetical protein [Methanobrevibacter arboriphilus]GLI11235.1 hypothetical protein MARBORIA2_03250 [Methanobrevibacter arboriphilus]
MIKRRKLFQELPIGGYIPIKANKFENPYSSSNLDGNLESLYNLFNLVDYIPIFADKYNTTSYSFARTYTNIVNFAIPKDKISKENFVLAKKKLSIEKFTNISFGSNDFYLVEANPIDFWEYDGFTLEFSVGPIGSNSDYENTKLEKNINLQYENASIVEIHRPWYCPEIFLSSNWGVRGWKIGEISSGTNPNDGYLPLVSTHLILSKFIQGKTRDTPYLVAVISDIIPESPTEEILKNKKIAENQLLNNENILNTSKNQEATQGKIDLLSK